MYVSALLLFLVAMSFAWGSSRRLRGRLEFRAMLLDELALAARRGVPLQTGLAWAAEELDGGQRLTVLGVEAELAAGASTAEALRAAAPREFPLHVLAAVRAADGSPRLASTLETAATEGREQARYVQRAWLALAYPLVLGAAVTIFASRWQSFLGSALAVADAPAAMEQSGLAVRVATVVLVGSAAALLLCGLWPAVARLFGRRADDLRRLFGRLPGVRDAVTLDNAARLLGALSAFAAAGEPLDIALEEAADAVGDPRTAGHVREAARRAAHGEPPERVWAVLPVPESTRVRGAVACTRAAPICAANLADLARECRVRWRGRVERWATAAQPAALLAVGALLALQYRAVFRSLDAIREAYRLW